MKILKIILLIVFVALVMGLTAGSLIVRSIATKALPDYNAKLSLAGLKDKVIVFRDAHAIPHVYAKNEPDLYRAVGYCMAQDRMWQMDLLRRACQGRLAEILGKDLVEVDLLMRALRIPDKSKLMLSQADSSMTTGLIIFWMICCLAVVETLSVLGARTASVCCVEITIASIRRGTEPAYSTVTWLFPSGRSHLRIPSSRAK